MSATAPTSQSPVKTLSVEDPRVECVECGHKSHSLVTHLRTAHSMTVEAYQAKHAGAATVSRMLLEAWEKKQRREAPLVTQLETTLMGLKVRVDAGADPEECLPLPEGYQFPTMGAAYESFRRALMALIRGHNLFLWGMPGTGKDALIHAFSALTRRQAMMVSFKPGTDIEPWFYTREITKAGTSWSYGAMWRALTEGIAGRDGVRRPALIVLSDVDRADQAQAEWFRLLTDSISGRIMGPDGKTVPLFPGTQFACTANSCGTGDDRGRMASSQVMDSSITDRLGRKVEAAYMAWEDEGRILRSKFAMLAERQPALFSELGAAVEALRKSIDAGMLGAELTHRGLCEILKECEDFVYFDGSAQLGQGFQAWTHGLDAANRLAANRLIDPHITGGALGQK